MIWEEALLYITLSLFAGSFLALAARRRRIARLVLLAASVAGISGFLSFVYLFLSNDFATLVVFQNSSSDLAIPFKVVAALEGAGGSLLLWLAMMSATLLYYELSKTPSMSTAFVVNIFTLYVAVALAFVDPFAQLGGTYPNGVGLTPSLQSYWALVHPPIVFAAYTAMVFLFAGIVSQRWQSRKTGQTPLVNARLLTTTWLLLGMGLLFGGIWAYQTGGWGGYWAWDPIETSALIPWLALTAVLFTGRLGLREKNGLGLFGINFSACTLFFTSYVARGSAAPSIHSYGDLASGAPFITLSLLPLLISLPVIRQRNLGEVRPSLWDADLRRLLEFVCLMVLASANLGLLLLETVGHVFGVNFVPNVGAHNLVSFPFVVGLCILLIAGCMGRGSKTAMTVQGIVVLISGGLALAYALASIGDPTADFTVPFAAALFSSAILSLLMLAAKGQQAITLAGTARLLTMLGISILLVGVVLSSSTRASTDGTIGVGQNLSVAGESVTIGNIGTAPTSNTIYVPGYGVVKESIDTSVSYALGGHGAGGGVALLRYFPARDVYVPVPSIQSTFSGDLYLAVTQTPGIVRATSASFFNGTSSDPLEVTVTAQFIPDVSFVWIGAVILLLANLPYAFLASHPARSEQEGVGQVSCVEGQGSNDQDRASVSPNIGSEVPRSRVYRLGLALPTMRIVSRTYIGLNGAEFK